MTYLAQSIRNAYDMRDREYLERMLLRVEALEKRPKPEPQPHNPPPEAPDNHLHGPGA